jgi:hypothetical protein
MLNPNDAAMLIFNDAQQAGIRLLPVIYVEMSPEKEAQAVAAVAGLIGAVAENQREMALTLSASSRSGLDQPSPRPGEGGGNGIEEDHGAAGPGPHHGRGDPRRALPPEDGIPIVRDSP